MEIFDRNLRVLNTFSETMLSVRRRAEDFSRYKKMGFSNIISCMLNFFKKDAQIEVEEFFKNIKRMDTTMSGSDELIQEENASKDLKREYKTNQKRLIAKLKNNLIKIVAEDDITKKGAMLNQLIDEIHKKPVAITPDRSFPRVKKGSSIKFPKNKKRTL